MYRFNIAVLFPEPLNHQLDGECRCLITEKGRVVKVVQVLKFCENYMLGLQRLWNFYLFAARFCLLAALTRS